MGMFSKGIVAALVGGILAISGGCSGSKVSDDAIAKDVQEKVSMDPATKDSPVNVTAKDGKVILRGTVKDAATQKRMEDIAKATPGASGVEDKRGLINATAPDAVPGNTPASGGDSPATSAPAAAAAPAPIVV